MTAEPDLDLAFEAAENLPEYLVQAAADLCDPSAELSRAWADSGWLAQLSAELPASLQAPAYSLGLSLVCDEEIEALNSEWRDKAGPTDVLAFAAQDDGLDDAPAIPMPDFDVEEGLLDALELGDIVISIETAARQAPEHQHSLRDELLFLATHAAPPAGVGSRRRQLG